MNLHRTNGKPEWETIPSSKRTSIQTIAHKTRGILTPPNCITVIGLLVVFYGLIALLSQHYWTGLVCLAAGRLLDIVDGFVAEKTGTKSPLGEALDAAVDKFGTLLTIIVFFVIGVADWWVILLLILPQIVTPLVMFYKRQSGIRLHPTRVGKLGMATAWLGLLSLIVVKALNLTWPSLFVVVASAVVALSIVLSFWALWQYAGTKD